MRKLVAAVALVIGGCDGNSAPQQVSKAAESDAAYAACLSDFSAWHGEKTAMESSPVVEGTLAKLTRKTDEVTGNVWHYADRQSQQTARTSTKSYFVAYFGKFRGAGIGPFRVQLQYGGEDWVFARHLVINADGDVYESIPEKDWKTDNSGGWVWETLDTTLDDFLPTAAFEKVLAAKKVIVRFRGRENSSDWVIPAAQRASVAKLYAAWKSTMPSRPVPKCKG